MRSTLCRGVAVGLLLLVASVCIRAAEASRTRLLTTNVLLGLDELDSAVLSPDGKWIAYVVMRPLASQKTYRPSVLEGRVRADVWLASTRGGVARNLTQGEAVGVGYWSPFWSPDSKRLAVMSIKGEHTDLATLTLEPGDAPKAVSSPSRALDPWEAPRWLSDHLLAYVVMPEGIKSIAARQSTQTMDETVNAWQKAAAGRATTASLLEAGVPDDYARRAKGQLRLTDVINGVTQVVADGDFSDLSPSPDRKYLAVLETVGIDRPRPNEMAMLSGPGGGRLHRLAVFTTRGVRLPLDSAAPPFTYATMRWRSSNSQLALLTTTRDIGHVYRYLLAATTTPSVIEEEVPLPTDAGVAQGLAWSPNGHAVVKMGPPLVDLRSGTSFVNAPLQRHDWWEITNDGRALNLTGSMRSPPEQLFDDGTRKQSQAMSRLNSDADVKSVSPKTGLVAYATLSNTGTHLWVSAPGKAPQHIVTVKTALSTVREGRTVTLDYQSLTGRPLKALLILPPQYEAGRQYPLVTEVYAGGDAEDSLDSTKLDLPAGEPLSLHPGLLAARGYAVLIPSIPLEVTGKPSDPYLDIPKGALPAVDQAIALGYADPNRLAVLGHSYGGYTTYSLITQTTRFKAAVAMAGPVDLVSFYGTLLAELRYDRAAQDSSWSVESVEGGQARMGSPPWKDAARYLRNSPLFHVDNVATPTLIIQGDMDYVAMQQGEEFFTALSRLGKRARFIRYRGEGHVVLNSPANIRDLWHQIFAWLDEQMDVSRDPQAELLWSDKTVKSRGSARALTAEDFARFDDLEDAAFIGTTSKAFFNADR